METYRPRIALFAILLAALGGAGCVTPVTEEDLKRELESAAAEMGGLGRSRVVPVYAETSLIAKALLYEARSAPEEGISLSLGRRMAIASKRKMSLVVGGPYPALSDLVLQNAFDLNRGEGLRGMKVVLVSAESPSPGRSTASTRCRAARVSMLRIQCSQEPKPP